MATRWQTIIDAVVTRLGQITPGKVYVLPSGNYTCTSTVTGGVSLWRKVPYGVNQVPAIGVWDSELNLEEQVFGFDDWRLQIMVAGIVKTGTADDLARALSADIHAAIKSDEQWGALARWTDAKSVKLDLQQEGDIVAACGYQLDIIYRMPEGFL